MKCIPARAAFVIISLNPKWSEKMKEYNFQEIESRWQEYWERTGLFRAEISAVDKKYYCLMMFPYPSAALHVGHGRNYIIGDAVARYKIMRGFNVLAPMGWDSFGLPAENAAIKHNIHPEEYTRRNIATMKRQLRQWGVGYDWGREISSCLPEYYRWTQWIFLRFYRAGLAYRKLAEANWCPRCRTTLANEQVIDGNCERCRSAVEKKSLEQWFFRITDYAQRLLDDLDTLDHWPERVKTMQKNWIGRSEGADVVFRTESGIEIPIFTTRPDTLWGATFMVLAPEHPLLERIAVPGQNKQLEEYRRSMAMMSEVTRSDAGREKTGVFTGSFAVNPVNGDRIPIYAADYVMMSYGSGAIMAVPAHDQRDFEFAAKFDIPVRVVIAPPGWKGEELERAYEEVNEGVMVNSGPFDGTPAREGKGKVTAWLESKGLGRFAVNYRLRDWLISRQRYWGAPIPIVYCGRCGAVPVPEDALPVLLPREVDFRPTGQSPLALSEEFKNTSCPSCGGAAVRETDTMDTFVDSSWYFLRYLTPGDSERAFDRGLCDRWLPVDQYIGGIEHATMHLIYARFVVKAFADQGLLGFSEPFRNLFTQGMICREAYYLPGRGYLQPDEVSRREGGAVHAPTGQEVEIRLEKMSKSKFNVVNPDGLLERFGADTVRLYTLFIGPPEKDAEWNDQAVEGASRFLKRLWKTTRYLAPQIQVTLEERLDSSRLSAEEKHLFRKIHQTIKKVTLDLEGDFHFNTAIAAAMELVNEIQAFTFPEGEKPGSEPRRRLLAFALQSLVRLLAPFVPHVCEELWRELGGKESVFLSGWPAFSPQVLQTERVTMVVQVNGRLRGRVTVNRDSDEEKISAEVFNLPKIREWLAGGKVVKTVVVPNRLVNLVVRPASNLSSGARS